MKKDLDVLLDCIGLQLDNRNNLKQSLLTIANMCAGNDDVKNHLRASKGLKLIQEVLVNTKFEEVKEVAMFCLGCAAENNVFSQKELCQPFIFEVLCTTLNSVESSVKTKQIATFLTVCLVANSGIGQLLVRKSGCLEILLKFFSTKYPNNLSSLKERAIGWFDNMDSGYKSEDPAQELWSSVVRALCVCVNNPQNVDNQQICASALPDAFKFLQSSNDLRIVEPITSFIALMSSDNGPVREKIYRCGGIDVLMSLLARCVDLLHDNSGFLDLALVYTKALDSAIMDNCKNVENCGSMGVIGLLLKLLSLPKLSTSGKVQVILTLEHCIEISDKNREELVRLEGLRTLVRLLTESNDQELVSVVKCILQMCFHIDEESEAVAISLDCNSHKTPRKNDSEPTKDKTVENVDEPPGQALVTSNANIEKDLSVRKNPDLSKTNCGCSNNVRSLTVENVGSSVREMNNMVSTTSSQILKERSCVGDAAVDSHHGSPAAECEKKTVFKRPGNVRHAVVGGNSVNRTSLRTIHLSPTPSCQSEFDLELAACAFAAPMSGMSSRNSTLQQKNSREPCTSGGSQNQRFSKRKLFVGTPGRNRTTDDKLKNINKCATDVQRSNVKENILAMNVQNFYHPTSAAKMHLNATKGSSESSISFASKRMSENNNHCPGCRSPQDLDLPLLNSLTFNIVLETNHHSCEMHRRIRKLERDNAIQIAQDSKRGSQKTKIPRPKYIERMSADTVNADDPSAVYDFGENSPSLSGFETISHCTLDEEISPKFKSSRNEQKRRKRVPYSRQEEENLTKGVNMFGKSWMQILNFYKFHPSRTSVDLKEKYKRMQSSPTNASLSHSTSSPRTNRTAVGPFSMAEERRLVRGVRMHGNRWTAILDEFKFAKGRTAEELRQKWRTINKSNC